MSLGLVAVIAAVAAVADTLSEQTALQRRNATQVTPTIFVIELLIPLLLAITVGGESWDRTRRRCARSSPELDCAS